MFPNLDHPSKVLVVLTSNYDFIFVLILEIVQSLVVIDLVEYYQTRAIDLTLSTNCFTVDRQILDELSSYVGLEHLLILRMHYSYTTYSSLFFYKPCC